MTDTLRPPSLQLHVPRDRDGSGLGGGAWSCSSTPTLRRRRFKLRRAKKVAGERAESLLQGRRPGLRSTTKEYLQLPSIEITPSSDEDAGWSNCSTPSASPRRKRFLLRRWLKVRERKELGSESSTTATQYTDKSAQDKQRGMQCSQQSSQHSSQQSSHDDDSTRFLTPFIREGEVDVLMFTL
ncbi:uncharacterized protein LOC143508674 [Brachyhypopomus gauderio]|uniref:uncharacterized protein LOC143508674 n=1 Tax=Brachyhypopomus gauderio TaxID=698409 RepID=UPI00404312FC